MDEKTYILVYLEQQTENEQTTVYLKETEPTLEKYLDDSYENIKTDTPWERQLVCILDGETRQIVDVEGFQTMFKDVMEEHL